MRFPTRARLGLTVFGGSVVWVALAACGDDRSSFNSDAVEPPTPPPFVDAGSAPAVEDPYVPPPTPVDVVITADNAYAFGWGDESQVKTYYETAPASGSGDIFNCPIGVGPEAYTVPTSEALPGAWLYVVGWSDYQVTQGVIGQFRHRGADAIYTGTEGWEVCAVGKPYPDNIGGPSQDIVNAEIATCSAGSGDRNATSAGWVDAKGAVTPNALGTLVFGQDNESDVDLRGRAGYDFPPVCKRDVTHDNQGIEGKARWMWYAPPDYKGNAFLATGENTTRSFLIFRFPTKALPAPEPPK